MAQGRRRTADSKLVHVTRWIGRQTVRHILLAVVFVPATAVMATSVDIDFTSPTDLNLFNHETCCGNTSVITWQPFAGVGNSASLNATRVHASVYNDASFNLADSPNGITVSSMFRTGQRGSVGSGSSETYGEIYLTKSPIGFPFDADVAFVNFGRISSGDRLSAGPLQAGGGSFPGFSVSYPEGTIQPNTWYEVKTTYSSSTNSLLTWDIEVNDFGSDGLAFQETIMSDQRTSSDPRNFFGSGELYAGFSVIGFGRTSAVDNFKVEDTFEPTDGVVTIGPAFDVKLIPTGFFSATTSIVDGDSSIGIGLNFNEEFPEERMLLEFSLADIPQDATIESVKLDLDFNASSGSPRIEIFGYQGDGLASLSDANPGGQVIGTSPPVSASTAFSESLDVDFVQSLMDQGASHLGLRLRSLDLPLYVSARTTESGFGEPPALIVEYVISGLAGDFNEDGMVDTADYTVWRDGLGDTYTSADYQTWRNNFGATADSSSSSSVPEPATVLLLIIAQMRLVTHRRR